MPPSKRAASVVPFLAMEVMERAFALEREGVEIIHLEIGEPEFPAPPAAVAACARALAEEPARYTDSRGLVELREAIAAERLIRNDVAFDAERVLITSGTSPALLLAFTYLLDPGEVFVLDGFSKRYAMTGFRLGHLIAPSSAARTLRSLAQNLFISVASFVQRAGIAALANGAGTIAELREAYATRRLLLMRGLQEIGFEVPVAPRGAFYVFADARRFASDSR